MLPRYALLCLAALFAAVPAAAQRLPHVDWALDAQTGEPVPFSAVAPPTYEADASVERGGEQLVVLDHWAEGSTKVARTDGDVVFYQNGALLISARLEGDPLGPTPLDTLALGGQPGDIALAGDRAYVGLRKARGVVVVDISDADDLREVGRADGREGISVAVNGDALYLGMGTAGVAVYDISADAPAFVRSFDTPGSANGFAVDGSLLFVADGNSANGPDARLYDVSDALNPTALGTIEADGFATGVALSGDVAYVAGAAGLIIADVSDPAAPVVLSTLSLGDETTYEIALSGEVAYVAGLGGVFTVDVADPAAPAILAQNVDGQQELAVTTGGAAVLVSDRFRGLRVLDPATLEQTALARNGGFSARATFDGGLLYVTDLSGALRIFEVVRDGTRDVEARLLSVTAVPANTQEVEVRDGRAYVTDSDFGGTGLTILDVSDPAAPTVLGGYASANQAFGLDVVGTTVYLCNGFSGLVVLDASDPANVVELGSFAFAANANDVVVDAENEVAYVVSFGGGMRSLDVSDPANIVELDAEAWGFLNAVSFAFPSPDFDASALYVADGQQGLRVVRALDQFDLQTSETVAVATQARDVAGSGDFFDDGIYSFANVADDFYGLRSFVNAGEVSLFGAFESADRGFGVATGAGKDGLGLGEPLALMSGETGVYFFEAPFFVSAEAEAEQEALRLDASPNPLAGRSAVRFALTQGGEARLDAFDVLGRRVAVLHAGSLPAGEHERTFDASGLPAGVYVLRLQTDAGTATTRVTVVR